MTIAEQIITIAMCTLGTMAMRFLPFLLGGFRDAQLGKDLLRREKVFCRFLRRELVQFFCFVERVIELLPLCIHCLFVKAEEGHLVQHRRAKGGHAYLACVGDVDLVTQHLSPRRQFKRVALR